MSEEEIKGTIETLQSNPLVKCGSYEFIGDSNITYAEIYILLELIRSQEQENQQLKATNESLTSLVNSCQKEIRQLKTENHRLEHNEKVLLKREERAINYIDQVIGYKSCASEIDEELNTLIGILRGGNNE